VDETLSGEISELDGGLSQGRLRLTPKRVSECFGHGGGSALRDEKGYMRAVIQRVKKASVTVADELLGSCGYGALVLLGVQKGDTETDADWMAEKVAGLRIFEDDEGKFNLSLEDIKGELLVVSQFTLLGDARKGRRPSFTDAAGGPEAEALYKYFVQKVREMGFPASEGRFGATMDVSLTNHGPVTILLDSRRLF
jgi:D-aminoacyl-tRNA deacylase